jgi:hypothetical protein
VHPNLLTTAEQCRQFIQAGNATLTLRSKATDARFTYKVQAPMNRDGTARDLGADTRFVKVLTGADNDTSYSYLGYIRRGVFFHGGHKAKVGRDAPSAKAFAWTWRQLVQDALPDTVEVWHEGRCGRCARKLTVPASIASGFGPECAGRVGLAMLVEEYAS